MLDGIPLGSSKSNQSSRWASCMPLVLSYEGAGFVVRYRS